MYRKNVSGIALTCAGIVHTDDRLALLEIARQLDVEDELGERISVCCYCQLLRATCISVVCVFVTAIICSGTELSTGSIAIRYLQYYYCVVQWEGLYWV